MSDNVRRTLVLMALAVGLTMFGARNLAAQGFISPFIGYDFGGDSGCPKIDNCGDKKLNFGVTLGAMGNVLGFEEEFAYAKDFFGSAPGISSSVLTVMSNVMLIPNIGPVRPYLTAGVGLIKTHVDGTVPSTVFTSDNNNFGWDAGGGVMVLFGGHVGVRGDIRYFHSFQSLNVLGLTFTDEKLDFGRASVALVAKF